MITAKKNANQPQMKPQQQQQQQVGQGPKVTVTGLGKVKPKTGFGPVTTGPKSVQITRPQGQGGRNVGMLTKTIKNPGQFQQQQRQQQQQQQQQQRPAHLMGNHKVQFMDPAG